MKPLIYCNLCHDQVPFENLISTKDIDKSKVSAKDSFSKDVIVTTEYCCKKCFSEYFA